MDLLNYLKKEPRARERANKNRAIANVVLQPYLKKFGINGNKEVMSDIVGEILSLDRKWRKILEENPDLRGTDYNDKQALEENKMSELGYEPNYNSNVAKLKTL
jgi:hypothetical protein